VTSDDQEGGPRVLTLSGAREPNLSTLPVATPWSELNLSEDERLLPMDPIRHELFRRLALDATRTLYPWLLPILEAAGARVLAVPGQFLIELPGPTWLEIPALSAQLVLLPWCEGETAQ